MRVFADRAGAVGCGGVWFLDRSELVNAPEIEPDLRKLLQRLFDQAKEALEVASTKVAMLEAMLLGGPQDEDTVSEE